MKPSQLLGPGVAFVGVAAATGVGLLADVHLAAWVLTAFLVVGALLRAIVHEPQNWGLKVRSLPVDVAILLVGAVVLVFLAQTAPDLY